MTEISVAVEFLLYLGAALACVVVFVIGLLRSDAGAREIECVKRDARIDALIAKRRRNRHG